MLHKVSCLSVVRDEINTEMENGHSYITVWPCLLNLITKIEGLRFVYLIF